VSKTSPTQRTLAECRRRGWTAQVVEKWNSHARVRQDLFGCIDVLALDTKPQFEFRGEPVYLGQGIIGIQACAGSSHAARLAKIKAEPRMAEWRRAGGVLLLWSWSKRGGKGKRKVWTLREEAVAP